MTSVTELYVNSDNSLSPESPWDFEVSVDLNLQDVYKSARVRLKDISIPLTNTPINRFNNILTLAEDNGVSPFSVDIPPGAYTGSEIATQLQTLLNISSPNLRTYTVSYITSTKKISISINSGNFKIFPCRAQRPLGFPDSQVLGTMVYTSTQTGAHVVRLDGSNYVFLTSSLGTRNISSNGRYDILARIPITQNFGSVQVYENNSDGFLDIGARDIDSIFFRLIDSQDNPYEIDNEVSFTLQFAFS